MMVRITGLDPESTLSFRGQPDMKEGKIETSVLRVILEIWCYEEPPFQRVVLGAEYIRF